MSNNRRKFIKTAGQTALSLGFASTFAVPMIGCSSKPKKDESTVNEESSAIKTSKELFFDISLAQWSLNRQLRAGELDNLNFAQTAKDRFDIHAVEYVNQFFADKAKDMDYLGEMKKRTDDLGMTNVLIMIDREGGLAELDAAKRNEAIENHYKWVEAAKFLGCHSIRVNAHSSTGTAEEVAQAAVEGLGKLTEFGEQHGVSIIVENHGGYSSNGQWLSGVIAQVGKDMCGTLPDFGNFCIERGRNENDEPICLEEYDRYKGTKELMPYAKGVSAKANKFDENGDEPEIDFRRLLKIVKDANFTGYIGIEFEGPTDAYEGIQATKDLLIKAGSELS